MIFIKTWEPPQAKRLSNMNKRWSKTTETGCICEPLGIRQEWNFSLLWWILPCLHSKWNWNEMSMNIHAQLEKKKKNKKLITYQTKKQKDKNKKQWWNSKLNNIILREWPSQMMIKMVLKGGRGWSFTKGLSSGLLCRWSFIMASTALGSEGTTRFKMENLTRNSLFVCYTDTACKQQISFLCRM